MRKIIVLLYNILIIPYKLFNHISIFSILQKDKIGNKVRISKNVKLYRSKIDDFSYIRDNSFITDCEIGKYCSISSNVSIGGAAHPIDWAATSLKFYCINPKEEGKGKYFYKKPYPAFGRTKIGNDVWIGMNVLIKAGVTIADGAIIGFGSVITKDVGPYEIWAGNPAKLIRKRFDEQLINRFLTIKWWDLDYDTIRKYSKYIDDPIKFLDMVEKIDA